MKTAAAPIYVKNSPVDMMNDNGLSWSEVLEFISFYDPDNQGEKVLSLCGNTSSSLPVHYPPEAVKIHGNKGTVPWAFKGPISWIRYYPANSRYTKKPYPYFMISGGPIKAKTTEYICSSNIKTHAQWKKDEGRYLAHCKENVDAGYLPNLDKE